MFYPNEKIALFIDGSNMYAATKNLEFDIDYKKLRDVFAGKGRLVRAFYFTAMPEGDDYSPLKPLIDFLSYNGYRTVTKPMKSYTDSQGMQRNKGNMDIEIACEMLAMAGSVDHLILFSGDGDFRRLVEACQAKGSRVTVVSTTRSSPSMMSDDLRRQADDFVDLFDLQDQIGRAARPESPRLGDRRVRETT